MKCWMAWISPISLRLGVDHGQEDHAERFLHRGVLEELVQHDLRFGAALQLDHDPHAVAVAFVADVGDVVDGLAVDQLGDALDQPRLVHLVGNLGDDDGVALFGQVLDGRLGAHQEAAAAVGVGVLDSLASVDEAAGREVRPLHQLENLFERGVRLIDQLNGGVDDLAQVVRRNVGRHAHGDTVGAVDEQVGNPGRQDRGLNRSLVEVG